MRILVTGAAGFVGFHTTLRLLKEDHVVFGIDSLNAYYDVDLKRDRLRQLFDHPNFSFEAFDLVDEEHLDQVFRDFKPTHVIHLAAQAGVRYGSENPHAYVSSNLNGFFSVLENCRKHCVAHFLFASSSSVYGGLTERPFSEDKKVEFPLSLYAATKKSNELMAHSYSHLYGLPVSGLRLFTVYGPWGRPDMAIFSFVESIENNKPIQVFAHGRQTRDLTYVDDVVEAITRILPLAPEKTEASSAQAGGSPVGAPYRIVNIGNNRPVQLLHLIDTIEMALGKSAEKILCDAVSGDATDTHADVTELKNLTGFTPNTSIEAGVDHFVKWYRGYMMERKNRQLDTIPRIQKSAPVVELRSSFQSPAGMPAVKRRRAG